MPVAIGGIQMIILLTLEARLTREILLVMPILLERRDKIETIFRQFKIGCYEKIDYRIQMLTYIKEYYRQSGNSQQMKIFMYLN
jgi:hypothetical protein